MVETIGLEPMTPCTSSRYSSQLSYASEYSVSEQLIYYNIIKAKKQEFF